MNMDYRKWDKCGIEKTHLQFCKHILGVNRTCSYHLVKYEAGRYPVKTIIDTRIFLFLKHINSMPENSVVFQVLQIDRDLHVPGSPNLMTMHSFIKNYEMIDSGNLGVSGSIQCLSKKKIKELFHRSYESLSYSQLANNPKARYTYLSKGNRHMRHILKLLKIEKFVYNIQNSD